VSGGDGGAGLHGRHGKDGGVRQRMLQASFHAPGGTGKRVFWEAEVLINGGNFASAIVCRMQVVDEGAVRPGPHTGGNPVSVYRQYFASAWPV
jgi:hypothetical protein